MPPLRISSTGPKPFVFVAMPFAPVFDDAYEAAIKPACEAAGAYAERVDDQIFQGNILQRMYNQIAKADLIVVDTTSRNVNVLYETGYAHALRKHVIVVTRGNGDVVFDPTHHPHIVYERLVDLRNELERKVRDVLETMEQRTSPIAIPVAVMVDDVVLDPVIARDVTVVSQGNWAGFHLVVQNPVFRVIRTLALQIGMITPAELEIDADAKATMDRTRISADARLQVLRKDFLLLPGAWTKLWMTIDIEQHNESEAIPFAVRVMTAEGYYDFAFNLKIGPAAPEERTE
jgi:hypothetical protein